MEGPGGRSRRGRGGARPPEVRAVPQRPHGAHLDGPCGHVFCWRCIADWHNQKPECPLCRSAFTTSKLVCVYHSDF